MMKLYSLLSALLLSVATSYGQGVNVTVDASVGRKAVSPLIYGKNEEMKESAQFYKDSGLRFARVGGGNNMTGYNWRKHITIHPDWYNNVYAVDWDAHARKINEECPGMQAMFAFQLLGRVAKTHAYNFNDWDYNHSQWWEGVSQNLCGGGTPDAGGGSKAEKEGDLTLFSQEWPADSSVAIMRHWQDDLHLDMSHFRYWSMDNEPEIWSGTHDWAMPEQLPAKELCDRYIALAKKAKALNPNVRLCGPVTCNEWQWFKYASENITVDGQYMPWLEYFIKRCADEEKQSGVRVLDVFDIHSYPVADNDDEALQLHRLYFDTTYSYPHANGLHTLNGGWDAHINHEYIFQRAKSWIDRYFGENSGVGLGLSEWAPTVPSNDPSTVAVAYASHLGTFANNGMEFFSPWTWQTGMWEVLHLFTQYAQPIAVSSVSDHEEKVSAYTTVSQNNDRMTLVIVNRNRHTQQTVHIGIQNFGISDGTYDTYQLAQLPQHETFRSATDNALKHSTVDVASNRLSIVVPPLSVTAVVLSGTATRVSAINQEGLMADDAIYNLSGQRVAGALPRGVYIYKGKKMVK
jgi:hypothetical protein